ncbi:MAG: hypothetical protein FJY97_09475 [candidate division Zixibacteria bacterium]|nr:hypothetical protein [candidate division Zixibacteria bacterium]
MEKYANRPNKPRKKGPGRTIRRILLLVLLLGPSAVVLWELVFQPVLSLTHSVPEVSLSATSGIAFADSQTDPKDSVSVTDNLMKEQRFWQARLEAAQLDSIYLTLDMRQNALLLEVKGVTLRKVPIDRFEMSTMIRKMREAGQELPGAGRPNTMRIIKATVPKIPIRVLDMSKGVDSTAAAPASPTKPDSTEAVQLVSVIYEIEPGITLYVKQSGPMSRDNWYKEMEQFLRYRWENAVADVQKVLAGEPLQPDLWIKLEIPREDVLAIYRSLPGTPRLISRL